MSALSGRDRGVVHGGRLRRRRSLTLILAVVACAAIAASALTALLEPRHPAVTAEAPRPVVAVVPPPVAAPLHPLLDPRVALGPAPTTFAQSPQPVAGWRSAAIAPATETAPPATPSPPPAETQRMLEAAPFPAPRPGDLIAPPPAGTRVATPAAPRRSRVAAKPAETPDDRNFIQRLFGVPRQPGTVLAYAAPQDDVVDRGRGFRLSPAPSSPPPATSARTAIYDIEARTVYLPNGERLEAHSGFGAMMDDVRFAHVRMKGVTPPHAYDLVEREALFHGHRAIRLHPVGGSGAIYGRAGLLAHPYLLGPRGDSNGCVSIKDYERFLQAYLRGEIRRLVVVARSG